MISHNTLQCDGTETVSHRGVVVIGADMVGRRKVLKWNAEVLPGYEAYFYPRICLQLNGEIFEQPITLPL